eukprot:2242686-Prymnesium_polylepis.1
MALRSLARRGAWLNSPTRSFRGTRPGCGGARAVAARLRRLHLSKVVQARGDVVDDGATDGVVFGWARLLRHR